MRQQYTIFYGINQNWVLEGGAFSNNIRIIIKKE